MQSPKKTQPASPVKLAQSVPMSPVSSQQSPRQPIRSSAEYASDDEEGGRKSIAPLLARQSFDSSLTKVESPREVTRTWRDNLESFRQRNTGLLLVAASQLFFAAMAAGVAYLSQLSEAAVPTSELIATRMGITGICCHLWLRWKGDPHKWLGPPGVRGLLVLRGIVGWFGLFGVYFALRFLPLSDAVVLTFLSPAFTGILAFVALSEPYRVVEAISAFVSLGGVVLIAKPTVLFSKEHVEPILVNGKEVTDQQRFVAVCVSLIGCCGAAGAYTVLRLIGKRASPMHSMQYFSVWSTFLACFGPILMPKQQRWFMPTNPLFVVLLVAIGITGFFGQILLAMAFQREKAGRAALATFLQAPIAMILERLIFGRTMDALSFLGASVIISSAVFTLITKPKDEKLPTRLASHAGVACEAGMDREEEASTPILSRAEAKSLPITTEDATLTRVPDTPRTRSALDDP